VRRNTDGQIGESPGVESDLVEQNRKARPPKRIYIARTLVQDHQEVPVRFLNATHHDQVLMRGFPLAHWWLPGAKYQIQKRSLEWSIRRSLGRRLHWKLLEQWRSGIGSRI
jgi:hypothetical protein